MFAEVFQSTAPAACRTKIAKPLSRVAMASRAFILLLYGGNPFAIRPATARPQLWNRDTTQRPAASSYLNVTVASNARGLGFPPHDTM